MQTCVHCVLEMIIILLIRQNRIWCDAHSNGEFACIVFIGCQGMTNLELRPSGGPGLDL